MTYNELLKHDILSEYEERYLIGEAQKGCEQSRERLILLNMRLVRWICEKYATETVSAEDLIGDGVPGLMKAIDKMDLTLGTRLSTYAAFWIHCTVERSPLLQTTIRLPEYKKHELKKVKKAIVELEQQGNSQPSNEDIVDLIEDFTPQTVAELRRLIATTSDVISLDAPLPSDSEDNDFSLSNVLGDDDPVYEKLLNEVSLDFFLSKLPPHEEFVLTRSYGIPREMEKSEIAAAVRCAPKEVTKIEERALAKCQRIAKYLKSMPMLTNDENWAYIMADPEESPQMEFLLTFD